MVWDRRGPLRLEQLDHMTGALPHYIRLGLAAVAFISLTLTVARAADPPRHETTPRLEQLKGEHQHILDQLNEKDGRGNAMELDDPRIPALLRKGWDLAGAWAAEYLEIHPRPSRRGLKGIFEDFAPKPRGSKAKYGDYLEYNEHFFNGSAVRVGPSTYVVEASYGVDFRTSTFMVVARNGRSRFQALWNIKDLAEKHYAQRDEIGRWMHLVRRAYYNGPLVVEKVLRVFPAANGHARFLVDAYEAADGGTTFAQLSIWEWDGAQAKPLLVDVYYYPIGWRRFRFDGRTIRISTKEETEFFYSCGSCNLPEGIWTVRITPRGVRDVGHRFLEPEIRWAEDLVSKITKAEDTTKLADRKVVNALKTLMHERPAEAGEEKGRSGKVEFWVGMLEAVRILRRGRLGSFVLVGDDATLRFSYLLRHNRPYFTRVKVLPS
jgi:hypothetical protein